MVAELGEYSLSCTRQDFVQKVAAVMTERHLPVTLETLLRDVAKYRFESHGIVELNIRSAHPLTEKEIVEIKTFVQAEIKGVSHVVATEQIDNSLLGGFVLEFAQEEIDASVRKKIQLLKQRMQAH